MNGIGERIPFPMMVDLRRALHESARLLFSSDLVEVMAKVFEMG
jgi:hypothetical protein